MLKALGALAAVLLVLHQFFSYPVNASEYAVSGNGENSTSQINVNSKTPSKVEQKNSLDIENNIESDAQTGSNSVNNNSGEVEIKTGDVTQNIEVQTSGNDNQTSVGCCESDSNDLEIKGNGSETENQVNLNQKSSTTLKSSNNLSIKNNIKIHASTGGNRANNNEGDVYISTGNVTVDLTVLNKVNSNNLTDECCKKSSPSPTPTPDPITLSGDSSSPPSQGSCCSPTTDIPGPGGSSGGVSDTSNSGSSSSGGEVLGATLAATGGFSLWTLTLLALLMLILGVILRTDLTNAANKLKKIFGEFIYSARSYAFGVYLFTNLKVLSSPKF